MNNRDYAYVAAHFGDKSVKPFIKLTSQIVNSSDLFVSDKTAYINGDVSKLLHMTFFYGLINDRVDTDEIKNYCKSFKLDCLHLGGLSLRKDYSGLCQILWVDVLDTKFKLKKISESFKRFKYEEDVQFEFIPHLTLAYVKLDYKLPSTIQNYPKEIAVREIKYFRS